MAAATTSGRKAVWIWLGRLLVAGAVVAAWALWLLLRGNPESHALRSLLQRGRLECGVGRAARADGTVPGAS